MFNDNDTDNLVPRSSQSDSTFVGDRVFPQQCSVPFDRGVR